MRSNKRAFYIKSHLSSNSQITGVVTHFWTPCLLEDWQKQMKEIFFGNPVWPVFCSLYPFPLLSKLSGFLDWLGVFIMLNSFLRYLVFKVE